MGQREGREGIRCGRERGIQGGKNEKKRGGNVR